MIYEMIINMLVGLFQLYIVRRLLILLAGRKAYHVKIEILVYVLFYGVMLGVFWWMKSGWLQILFLIPAVFGITWLYTRKLKMSLYLTAAVTILNVVCNMIAALLVLEQNSVEGFPRPQKVMAVLLLFICEVIIEKMINQKKSEPGTDSMPLVFVPACSVAVLVFWQSANGGTDIRNVVVTVNLLIVNFSVFYLYYMLTESFEQKKENELLRQRIEIYANQIDTILESEEQVRRLRHDMKHHINELKILAAKEDASLIEQYMEQMEEFLQTPKEMVSSGNGKIDSLLNYMLQKAEKLLNSVTVKVQLPENLSHSFDINIVIGNLLENAIEAAQKTKEKQLKVLILWKQGVLRMEIANSFQGEVKLNQQGIATTKKEEGHGIGLKSIEKIVEKYNGMMDISYKNREFCVKVMLYISE